LFLFLKEEGILPQKGKRVGESLSGKKVWPGIASPAKKEGEVPPEVPVSTSGNSPGRGIKRENKSAVTYGKRD